MAPLVVGIVANVLRHIAVQDLKGGRVERIAAGDGELIVLSPSEFGVLLPQIVFYDFRRGEQPEDGDVAFGRAIAGFIGEQR